MKGHKIEINKRELSTKKSFVKQLRRQDEIPGIYYSHNSKSSIPLTINKKVLYEALKSDSQVYQITVGSKNRDVIIKSVQYHPMSDEMLHIDLYGVKMDQEVTVKVPINLIGQAEGIRAGGVLNQTLTELEISCLPGDIPQNIEIDITDLNIGDSMRIEQLSVAENLKIEGDTELLIVSIVQPAKVDEPEDLEIDDTIESEDEISDDESSESQPDTDSEKPE